MRPTLRLLEDPLVDRILDEARTLIAELGVEIHNPCVLGLLADHGAAVDRAASRAVFTAIITVMVMGTCELSHGGKPTIAAPCKQCIISQQMIS